MIAFFEDVSSKTPSLRFNICLREKHMFSLRDNIETENIKNGNLKSQFLKTKTMKYVFLRKITWYPEVSIVGPTRIFQNVMLLRNHEKTTVWGVLGLLCFIICFFCCVSASSAISSLSLLVAFPSCRRLRCHPGVHPA